MWFLDSKSSLRFDSNLDFESKIHVLSRLVQYVLLLTEVIIAPGFIKKLNIKHYPVIVCLWLTTTQGKINFSWFRQDLWFFSWNTHFISPQIFLVKKFPIGSWATYSSRWPSYYQCRQFWRDSNPQRCRQDGNSPSAMTTRPRLHA